jgi:hypothetical protein
MYEAEETFVVLDPNQLEEEFMTGEELLIKLKQILSQTPADELTPDIRKYSSIDDRAKYLLTTGCELQIAPGKTLQWYVVRLEK